MLALIVVIGWSAMARSDPALVIEQPETVTWRTLDPSRTWAVLAGVVGYATARAPSMPGAPRYDVIRERSSARV